MALKKTVTTLHGFEAVDAYHKVVSPHVIGKETLSFSLESFNISPEDNPQPFRQNSYTTAFEMESELNVFEQAYIYLKTLTAWEDAEDC